MCCLSHGKDLNGPSFLAVYFSNISFMMDENSDIVLDFTEMKKMKMLESLAKCKQCYMQSKLYQTDMVNENLIYSSTSYRTLFGTGLEDRFPSFKKFLATEAIIKTYPTDKLTRELAKVLARDFALDALVIGKMISGEEILELDAKTEKFTLREDLDDLPQDRKTPTLGIAYVGVESRIAGSVAYRLRDDSKSLAGSSIDDVVPDLIHLGKRFGYWYVAHRVGGRSSGIDLTIVFEASSSPHRTRVPEHLYHVTLASNEPKIFKQGLVPRSKSSSNNDVTLRHQERVYFFTEYDLQAFARFMHLAAKAPQKLHSKQFGSLKEESRYSVLEVDLKKVNNLKLYRDDMVDPQNLRHPFAVFTFNTIPPDALQVKSRFRIRGHIDEEKDTFESC